MLKYVLALLALVVVSLAPVYADEGYIPFFPDFLEPDGIGFRGPTELLYRSCLKRAEIKDDQVCSNDILIGVPKRPKCLRN